MEIIHVYTLCILLSIWCLTCLISLEEDAFFSCSRWVEMWSQLVDEGKRDEGRSGIKTSSFLHDTPEQTSGQKGSAHVACLLRYWSGSLSFHGSVLSEVLQWSQVTWTPCMRDTRVPAEVCALRAFICLFNKNLTKGLWTVSESDALYLYLLSQHTAFNFLVSLYFINSAYFVVFSIHISKSSTCLGDGCWDLGFVTSILVKIFKYIFKYVFKLPLKIVSIFASPWCFTRRSH